jgi:hypothetical protein
MAREGGFRLPPPDPHPLPQLLALSCGRLHGQYSAPSSYPPALHSSSTSACDPRTYFAYPVTVLPRAAGCTAPHRLSYTTGIPLLWPVCTEYTLGPLIGACSQQPARLQAACQPAPPGATSGHRLPEDAAPRRVTYVLFSSWSPHPERSSVVLSAIGPYSVRTIRL